MNMYLNLEYTKQHLKTWFTKREFRECTSIAYAQQGQSWLPFGRVPVTSCTLKLLQLSKQSSPKAWGKGGGVVVWILETLHYCSQKPNSSVHSVAQESVCSVCLQNGDSSGSNF